MESTPDNVSIANMLGPWIDPEWESGLIERCKKAWNKPLKELSNEELATLLRQRVAVQYLLPIAKKRIDDDVDDDTEMYDGELEAAIEYASRV
jgi:hypothetical protein